MTETAEDYWRWLISHIEDWWGDALTNDLVNRIASAPREHIVAFCNSIDRVPENFAEIPVIPDGRIRPLVASADVGPYRVNPSNLNTALRLLLYSHEVMLESDFVNILYSLSDAVLVTPTARTYLRNAIRQLMTLRPLICAGVVHFSHVASAGRHPSGYGRLQSALKDPEVHTLMREIAGIPPGKPADINELASKMVIHFGVLNCAVMLAGIDVANPLARSDAEFKVLQSLVGAPIVDGRQGLIGTLARLPVPTFEYQPELLINLRASEAVFQQFRGKLSAALEHIESLSDSTDLRKASEIVSIELSSATSDIERAVAKSPTLQAARGGFSKFGIGAISAVGAGYATTGSPWGGIVGAATSQTVEGIRTYVEAIRSRRSGRLILDVVAQFEA